jgi:hypothetical protein
MSMIEDHVENQVLGDGTDDSELRRVASMITHERVLAGRNFY